MRFIRREDSCHCKSCSHIRITEQPAIGDHRISIAAVDVGGTAASHSLQGATATVSLRQPRTEAHLSQLAVLENFAEHGLYVKFSNEEAEELEREALALALEESTLEVGSDRSVPCPRRVTTLFQPSSCLPHSMTVLWMACTIASFRHRAAQ